jgi:RNA polymerase sigma-70 factor (ECF subfamily)
MCFHASRFDARIAPDGELILYDDQDTSLWNKELIINGERFLNMAAKGDLISKYHIEAAIAYWHTADKDSPEKWEKVLSLYNRLLIIEYSPIAALNRTYALAKVYGNETAIIEAEKLKLDNSNLYHGLLGELYTGVDNDKAIDHLTIASKLTKASADRKVILKKIEKLKAT